ncbi:MAG: hypothetical protein K0M63_02455 [Weeksellaceae bacterium]|nr:hypothetical protein [Weeksellaceae bacterium]
MRKLLEKKSIFRIIPLLLITFLAFTGCREDNSAFGTANAYVLQHAGMGGPCQDNFLVKILAPTQGIPANTTDNIFMEVNLPEQYRVKNRSITIKFRTPTAAERLTCTGTEKFPQLFIESVQ